MAYVLRVPAFQLSDPVTGMILMEAHNFLLHRVNVYEAVRMASDFASR
jgi:hypothetical protein